MVTIKVPTLARPPLPLATERKRQRRGWEWLTFPIGLALLLALWQAVVTWGGYPAFILPAPATVAARLGAEIVSGRLWPHLGVTLLETVTGFALGLLLALPMGYGLSKSPIAARLVSPWVVALQAIPVVAIAPLLIIWFGFGITSKILVCAWIVFFPLLLSTLVGLRSVDREWRELAQVLRADPWQTFRYVEWPAALPILFGGLKVGVTLAVVGAVVGEFAGARVGLGALITIARGGLYDTPLLFVALLTLATMALTLYSLVCGLERWMVKWQR